MDDLLEGEDLAEDGTYMVTVNNLVFQKIVTTATREFNLSTAVLEQTMDLLKVEKRSAVFPFRRWGCLDAPAKASDPGRSPGFQSYAVVSHLPL